MKPLILAAIFAVALPAASAEPVDLILEINGARSSTGQIVATLFDSDKSYMRRPSLERRANVSSEGRAEIIFDGLAPGDYAVSIFHDADADGSLDTGLFGIPSEDIGFSNNARGRFGPAKWKDAKFQLGDEGGSINIRLGRAKRN